MQYIQKQPTEPADWNQWFTVPPGVRTFDYKVADARLTQLARAFLIQEQHGLCAYCQQTITLADSSIEHVTPKTHNRELSTVYFNLVAVCKRNQIKDSTTGRTHCDSTRGSTLLPPIIFYANATSRENKVNRYFDVGSNGKIEPKRGLDESTSKQVSAFIEILNLNHETSFTEGRRTPLGEYGRPTADCPKAATNAPYFGECNTSVS